MTASTATQVNGMIDLNCLYLFNGPSTCPVVAYLQRENKMEYLQKVMTLQLFIFKSVALPSSGFRK